ncbi:hypothetical protein [Rhizobium sp.]|uniref:hypothetical protein n=1 Tax=Rhizobium sp. TaxID=391 RepID=UPI003F8196FA
MSEPHPRTIATLDKLDSVEWFVNVGKRDQSYAAYVNSWDTAIETCSALEWENLTLEAANQLRERIGEKSKERSNQWNMVLKIVKPFSDALVRDKSEQIALRNKLPDTFLSCVRWDIFHLCMEAEYSDLVEPGFFSSLSYYYFKGHFPCGFSGVFPEGKFIVY